jgi:hypothetical protein
MRYWDNKEVPGRGIKFCLVIDPEDGTHPIRTYGWSQEEVLEKVAKTAETAQQHINRLRSQPAAVSAVAPNAERTPATSAPRAPRPLTADEQLQATADLSNPAKAPQAIKTLLRGAGVDLDQAQIQQDARTAAAVAQEWEGQHPEFPSDERNQRLLMDKAVMLMGGKQHLGKLTAEILDAAYSELLRFNMLFDVEPSQPTTTTPPNAPDGNPTTRNVRPRGATSYRSTALRGSAPVAQPNKPRYTRSEIDQMNTAQLRDKIEHEPGFKEWFNREFSATA